MSSDWAENHDIGLFVAECVFDAVLGKRKRSPCTARKCKIPKNPRVGWFNKVVRPRLEEWLDLNTPPTADTGARNYLYKICAKRCGLTGRNYHRSRADHDKGYEDRSNALFIEEGGNNSSRGHAPMSTQTQEELCSFCETTAIGDEATTLEATLDEADKKMKLREESLARLSVDKAKLLDFFKTARVGATYHIEKCNRFQRAQIHTFCGGLLKSRGLELDHKSDHMHGTDDDADEDDYYETTMRITLLGRTDVTTPSVQCIGVTKAGHRCRIASYQQHVQAADTLREGGIYCQLHLPAMVQCEGTRVDGERCTITNRMQHAEAAPLRDGQRWCVHHQLVPTPTSADKVNDSLSTPTKAEPVESPCDGRDEWTTEMEIVLAAAEAAYAGRSTSERIHAAASTDEPAPMPHSPLQIGGCAEHPVDVEAAAAAAAAAEEAEAERILADELGIVL